MALRRDAPADHPTVAKLNAFLVGGEELFLSGAILQEILQAFPRETVVQEVARYLEPFPLLPLDREGCRVAARLYRRCRARGVSVSTIDCRIAAAAIVHECLLLSADEDFGRIASGCPLRLA